MLPKRIIYTDGSFRPGGFGAYAYLIMDENHQELHTHVEKVFNSTINAMELTAIAAALDALDEPCSVRVYSDSQYAVNCVTKWIYGWVKNQWVTITGQAVKNRDILERIHEAKSKHKIWFEWVRGHDTNAHNNKIDKLARDATQEMANDARRTQ